MCAKFQGYLIKHLCFIAMFQSVQKDEEKENKTRNKMKFWPLISRK